MKKRRTKLFLKAFKVMNAEGGFTKEDFNLLKEKFEIIREVYFHENENHDYYDSFRTITKEIKRASHNAGLKADIVNLDYKSTPKNIELINPDFNDVEFNLFIMIKSAAKFTREFDFVVTTIQGFNNYITLSGSSVDNPIPYKVTINDDMSDEIDVSYYYMEE